MSEKDSALIKSIAVLGGTGKEGSALAKRWAINGYRVIIGSRSAEKAQQAVVEMNAELGGDYLIGMSNEDAIAEAGLIVLSVPYSGHHDTLSGIKSLLSGKILVDLTVPVVPPNVATVTLPKGGAAALEARAILGDSVRLVSAFQNVSYVKIKNLEGAVDCDVLVTGDDESAKEEVIQLIESAGMRGIDAGPLENAVAAEALTPVLLYINKKYKVKGAGIRITGMDN